MVKMRNMRASGGDKKAGKDADGMRGDGGAPDGVHVRLEHDHIKRLGMDGPLPHGTPVEFSGEGEVADSGTHEGMDGEPRHFMTLRLHRAGIDGDKADEGRAAGLKDTIKAATDASEAKRADRDAGRGRERTGAKVVEKAGG